MQRKFLIVLAAALFAVPAATADWMAFGSFEPDTQFDVADGLMVLEPDHDKNAQQLFFNVYQTIETTGTSVNSGTLGSRIVNPPARNFHAILGAWKDCNADGYVGLAESALLVYPTPVLNATQTGICDVGSIHNDGQWVWEYLPTGYDPTEETQNVHPKQIEDRDARIWGDLGLPADGPSGACTISPLPHGTTSGTGWVLRYVDCNTGRRIARTVNENDPDGRLSFDDVENPQRGPSVLNQQLPESLFGNPETQETGTLQLDSEEDGGQEEAAFTTFDCGQDGTRRDAGVRDPLNVQQDVGGVATIGTRGYVINDPTYNGEDGLISGNYGKEDENFTNSDGDYAWIAHVDPKVNDPADSMADGLNSTFRGFRVGGGDENHDFTVGGDCNTVGDDEDGDNTFSENYQVYEVVDGADNNQVSSKKATDFYFVYNNGDEQEAETAELFGSNAPTTVVTTGPTTSTFFFQQGWLGLPNLITDPQLVRANVNNPTAFGQRPEYMTWYAKVGTGLLNQGWSATGTQKEYGSEECTSYTSNTPSVHNWSCNKAQWNTDANGIKVEDTNSVFWVEVGTPYQFRDIDCFDGEIARGTGVRASGTEFADDDPAHPELPANRCYAPGDEPEQ